MNLQTIQIICGLIIILSGTGYLITLARVRRGKKSDKILANASLVTFSTYILGFAFVLIYAQLFSVSVKKMIVAFLIQVAVVCLINLAATIYYQKKFENNG